MMDYIHQPIILPNLVKKLRACGSWWVDPPPFSPDAKGLFKPSAEAHSLDDCRRDDFLTGKYAPGYWIQSFLV